MSENKFTPEVAALVSGLRQVALSEEQNPLELKEAWKNYLTIKENLQLTPLGRVQLNQIRSVVDSLERGGLFEHNSSTSIATFDLQSDLGLVGNVGLIGELNDEEKEKAKSFVSKMSDVLIRQV